MNNPILKLKTVLSDLHLDKIILLKTGLLPLKEFKESIDFFSLLLGSVSTIFLFVYSIPQLKIFTAGFSQLSTFVFLIFFVISSVIAFYLLFKKAIFKPIHYFISHTNKSLLTNIELNLLLANLLEKHDKQFFLDTSILLEECINDPFLDKENKYSLNKFKDKLENFYSEGPSIEKLDYILNFYKEDLPNIIMQTQKGNNKKHLREELDNYKQQLLLKENNCLEINNEYSKLRKDL